ncbi:MAG: N-acetylglucosamine-6-phosphate deacetylase [Lentisphaeria bacterium]|nr:N-acetylglucosamine-6-phosphate deacetylase [Lentisphaeria bacterium]
MRNSGFVDLQINGNVGVDFSDPELTEEMFMKAADHIFASGTEVFLPTIVTSPKEVYLRNLAVMRKACEKHGLLKQVPGVHLEGPFISREPGAVGAHRPEYVIEPNCAFFDEIMDRSGNYVKLLTVAAEIPGVDALIRHASSRGVAVSCGHQQAGGEDLKAAAAAGAKLLTHLGNGCPNLINRHKNMIWAGMACDALTAMIITDGHHLPADLIKCFIRVKGPERIIVTSDAASIAGFPPGRYEMWGNHAILEPNGLFHNPEKGCLVGSSASMQDCVKFLRSLELLTESEIEMVSRTNPLKMIGML